MPRIATWCTTVPVAHQLTSNAGWAITAHMQLSDCIYLPLKWSTMIDGAVNNDSEERHLWHLTTSWFCRRQKHREIIDDSNLAVSRHVTADYTVNPELTTSLHRLSDQHFLQLKLSHVKMMWRNDSVRHLNRDDRQHKLGHVIASRWFQLPFGPSTFVPTLVRWRRRWFSSCSWLVDAVSRRHGDRVRIAHCLPSSVRATACVMYLVRDVTVFLQYGACVENPRTKVLPQSKPP